MKMKQPDTGPPVFVNKAAAARTSTDSPDSAAPEVGCPANAVVVQFGFVASRESFGG